MQKAGEPEDSRRGQQHDTDCQQSKTQLHLRTVVVYVYSRGGSICRKYRDISPMLVISVSYHISALYMSFFDIVSVTSEIPVNFMTFCHTFFANF